MEDELIQGLEQTIQKEAKKPGFFRRHFKKIALGTGACFLTAALGLGYIMFKKEGEVIKGQLDGKIDKEYYHSLVLNQNDIKDIKQIEDLVAEVYNLTTGKRIEDDFRFNFYDRKNAAPFRVKLANIKEGKKMAGLNWGNGDVYISRYDRFEDNISETFRLVFHEIGHGTSHSKAEHIKNMIKSLNNSEPFAEKNVIDSMLSLMYLEPDLGYIIYSKYMNELISQTNDGFESIKDKRDSALILNQIRCIHKGKFDIKSSYDSIEEVDKLVKKETQSKEYNQLVNEIYNGFLEMFKERFKDRPDFEEKYAKISKYINCGLTNYLYNKDRFSKEQLQESIKEKEEFLKTPHLSPIDYGAEYSLLEEYITIKDGEKVYKLREKIIGRLINEDNINITLLSMIEDNLKYVMEQNNKKESERIFNLLKEINIKNGGFFLEDDEIKEIENKIKFYN